MLIIVYFPHVFVFVEYTKNVGWSSINQNEHSDLCSTGPQFIWAAGLKTEGI